MKLLLFPLMIRHTTAYRNGYEWNSITCEKAAENNHFEILKWAHKNGCQMDAWVCEYAIKNNNLDMLKYALASDHKITKYVNLHDIAMKYKNTEILRL